MHHVQSNFMLVKMEEVASEGSYGTLILTVSIGWVMCITALPNNYSKNVSPPFGTYSSTIPTSNFKCGISLAIRLHLSHNES